MLTLLETFLFDLRRLDEYEIAKKLFPFIISSRCRPLLDHLIAISQEFISLSSEIFLSGELDCGLHEFASSFRESPQISLIMKLQLFAQIGVAAPSCKLCGQDQNYWPEVSGAYYERSLHTLSI